MPPKQIRGIGVEGVASEIGALGRHASSFTVDRDALVRSLMRRYNASKTAVEKAISNALRARVVHESNDKVSLMAE